MNEEKKIMLWYGKTKNITEFEKEAICMNAYFDEYVLLICVTNCFHFP